MRGTCPVDRRRDDVLAREHAALTEDLQALSREQWAQGSLCAGWTVHDVVARKSARKVAHARPSRSRAVRPREASGAEPAALARPTSAPLP
ncbi:maleylpyruvate isomerase N-terminal domain-containing protein [Brachybacterium sp. GCM10030267]|uniref:maleylpyruvate isomerase N-terminal domain-containing protein n=1 Tax=Brachybacterium sp. GCM10030267 TaxID=3273381 RepID=UPI00361978B1